MQCFKAKTKCRQPTGNNFVFFLAESGYVLPYEGSYNNSSCILYVFFHFYSFNSLQKYNLLMAREHCKYKSTTRWNRLLDNICSNILIMSLNEWKRVIEILFFFIYHSVTFCIHHIVFQTVLCKIFGKKYTSSGPRCWNVPVSVNTGKFLVYQKCLKMWYLSSLERAGGIQKQQYWNSKMV